MERGNFTLLQSNEDAIYRTIMAGQKVMYTICIFDTITIYCFFTLFPPFFVSPYFYYLLVY